MNIYLKWDFHLGEPEVKVLDACVEVLLFVGFFEFLALFCRFVDKELPLFIKSTEAGLQKGPAMSKHVADSFQFTFSHTTFEY